jgi:Patatin-like phospholipase
VVFHAADAEASVRPPLADRTRAAAGIRLGIAFSGGGIRSAAFSLGVYQYLEAAELFQRARYLAGVSGGAYIAAGLAVGHSHISEERYAAGERPWSRRSLEEQYLSRHLSYLAPEGSGRVWLIANLGYGLVMNLLPLVAAAILVGRSLGLLYHGLLPGLPQGDVVSWLPVELCALVAFALCAVALVDVGVRRFLNTPARRLGPDRLTRHEQVAMITLSTAAGLLLVGVALPLLVYVITTRLSWMIPTSNPGSLRWSFWRIGLGIVLVLTSCAFGAIAISYLSRGRYPRLRTALATLSGPGILVVPLVLSAQSESILGWRGNNDFAVLLTLGAVLVAFALFAHNRRYSMHLYYRERLQDAFALVRENNEIRPVPYEEPILLSKIAETLRDRRVRGVVRFPELIICAAVAARGGRAPHKARAVSFTFEGATSGNPAEGITFPTTWLERRTWLGGGELTLPSLMAISGAALSPLMGRFTLPAFRLLMAVLNIRLGVWLENPNRRIRTRWLAKLDAWADDSSKTKFYLRALRRMWRGWREPGSWFVLREGLGQADTSGRFLYVTDGGHWENLGFVELLRRGCTQIMCVDASSNAVADLGRATAIARRDLGVEVTMAPNELEHLETRPDGLARDPIAVGTLKYPDGRDGQIYVAQCVLWDSAPADLLILGHGGSLFPHHPTAQQFLSGEEFEAYRALGWAVGRRLVEAARLPPSDFDE